MSWSEDDHRRLAALLNTTPALVALSYYDHSWVADLYPSARWRRLLWTQPKSVEKTRRRRQQGQEVLLMNYAPAPSGRIWRLPGLNAERVKAADHKRRFLAAAQKIEKVYEGTRLISLGLKPRVLRRGLLTWTRRANGLLTIDTRLCHQAVQPCWIA